MKIESTSTFGKDGYGVNLRFSNFLDQVAPEMIMRAIAEKVAEKYVADHYQEIAALIDQNALATLSVAEAAAKVRETLAQKLPDKIVEVTRTQKEVWQRDVLGGMTRVF